MREKKYKRTIQKSCFWEICMVLCIMMILPVNISLLFLNKEEKTEQDVEEQVLDSPLEWQVLHELAAVIPVDYEPETLKAQAIILRTNILSARYEEDAEAREQTGLLFSYKEEWGEDYEQNFEKLLEAVRQTKGMYIEFGGQIKRASYFRLSNGRTRNGTECLGEEYTQFGDKECGKDLLSKEFLWKKKFTGSEFADIMGEIAGKAMDHEMLRNMEITYANDSAGYVLYVNIGDVKIGGEKFRKNFGLPSSDFEIFMEEEQVIIQVKGIGNGLGFSQYGANEMAKEGGDFLDLLNYFFTNIAISKTE